MTICGGPNGAATVYKTGVSVYEQCFPIGILMHHKYYVGWCNEINPWIAKMGSNMTPQYLSETITKPGAQPAGADPMQRVGPL